MNDQSANSHIKTRGNIAAIASAILFGLEPLVALVAYAHGNNAIAFILYATVLAVIVLFIILKLMHISVRPDKGHLLPLIASGFFATLTTILLFISYNYIASGIATTLHFTYPTLVALGGVLIFKQKLTIQKILALVLSLGGVFCMADFSGNVSMLGIIIALVSGVTYTTYILIMDHSEIKHIHYLKLSFYMAIVKLVVTLIFGLFNHSLLIPVDAISILMMVLFTLGISIGAITLFQIGVRDSGGSDAAIFSMFEPITSIIVGITVFHDQLNILKLLGCVLILSGILLTAAKGKKS